MHFRLRPSSDLLRGLNFFGDRLRSPQIRKVLADTIRIPEFAPFVVYFAGAPTDLYQVEQWIQPLRELEATAGTVSLLVANPRSAKALSEGTELPVVHAPTSDSVETFVSLHSVKALLYVNNNQANFTTLRINGPAHIHLSHGESEKSSMTSNQLKAYDYVFIAGQASQDRILQNVMRFDAEHLVQIGRPQFDRVSPLKFPDVPERTRVLYAPTWEGDAKNMSYGSLDSSGEGIVDALLSDERIQLVFRPHPKSGTTSASYARALARVKRRIQLANASAPTLHVFDTSADSIATIKGCQVVISDISAMSMDAIGLNVPLILTVQDGPRRVPRGYFENSPAGLRANIQTLDGLPLQALPAWLISQAASGPSPEQLRYSEYVFGKASAGNGTDRFIRAVQKAISDTFPAR